MNTSQFLMGSSQQSAYRNPLLPKIYYSNIFHDQRSYIIYGDIFGMLIVQKYRWVPQWVPTITNLKDPLVPTHKH